MHILRTEIFTLESLLSAFVKPLPFRDFPDSDITVFVLLRAHRDSFLPEHHYGSRMWRLFFTLPESCVMSFLGVCVNRCSPPWNNQFRHFVQTIADRQDITKNPTASPLLLYLYRASWRNVALPGDKPTRKGRKIWKRCVSDLGASRVTYEHSGGLRYETHPQVTLEAQC